MKNVSIRVELIGLMPEVYKVCTKCQPMDYLSLAGVDYLAEQVADYPQEILKEQKRLLELYDRLAKDFSSAVLLVPVGLISVRGLWLSIRHRLRNRPAVIIGGRRALPGDLPYENIRLAIEEELAKSDYTERGDKNGE